MDESKEGLLKNIRFGHEVAEEEKEELRKYFVETGFWQRIVAGEVDIVYGDKGAGKSAIYLLVLENSGEFLKRKIILVNAENPRGATAFRELATDPPATERQFQSLWKLYIVSIITSRLANEFGADSRIRSVSEVLREIGLLQNGKLNLGGLVKRASAYVANYFRPTSAEGGITLDPNTGVPVGVTGKVTFDTPTSAGDKNGFILIDSLYEKIQDFLAEQKLFVWVLLDRLDIAFDESEELEANALRALFRVYNDLKAVENLSLKIFLRTDIWSRITEGGFREASHIIKRETLGWSPDSLLNLVVKRLLSNDKLVNFYNVDKSKILSDLTLQKETFYRFFPQQVDLGEKKPETFDWMLSRTADGTRVNSPRELIALLNDLVRTQVARCERGEVLPEGDILFERTTFKDALESVSEKRLKQTLYAEYAKLKPYVEALKEQKAEQTVESLSKLWGLAAGEAQEYCDQLAKVGFFERRSSAEAGVTYWVPFIYRPALSLVQGRADN